MAKTTFHPAGWAPNPGYSHAVATGGGRLLYLSGQVAFDESNNLVGKGDFAAQARRVFENLTTVLQTAGSSWDRVIKLGYYIVDLDQTRLLAVREARKAYLPADPPASTLIGVPRLFIPDVWIEVEAVAEID